MINAINSSLPSAVRPSGVEGEDTAPLAGDVNGDGVVSPLDALLIIDFLNSEPAVVLAGEGEAPAIATGDAPAFDTLLDLLTSDIAASSNKKNA